MSSTSSDGPVGPAEPGSLVSPRWAQWRRSIPIPDYEERFARLAAQGRDSHGEADLIESYRPRSVLDAGCGTGRVAIEIARRGIEVVGVDLDDEMLEAARAKAPGIDWTREDLATLDLGCGFDVVALPGNVLLFCRPEDRSAVVRRSAAHVLPAGRLIVGFTLETGPDAVTLADVDLAAADEGLALDDRFATWERDRYDGGDYAVSVYRRPEEVAPAPRLTIHDLVAHARSGLDRVEPTALNEMLAADEPVVVLDTRTPEDRRRDGHIAGSVSTPRTVLEWRCDPASGTLIEQITGFDQLLVVVCNEGYSSSLAAETLQRLGHLRATDLIGGMAAWREAGLPVVHGDVDVLGA